MTIEDNNPLADLPTGEELLKEEQNQNTAAWLERAEQFRIKAADRYDEPDFTLSQNGIGFAPLGNIMALTAEMKHGKTFVNTTLAGALLKGEYMGLKCLVENPSVMFFDTEQDLSDGQRIQRRVHYIANLSGQPGWGFEEDNPRFTVFHLREIPFAERREFIEWAIRYYRPTVVFIDGIRDLLQDFNSLEESASLIQTLMELSSTCHCAIWTVLHVNPNSEKMRGHLGTELGNKVTDVFQVKKDKNYKTGEVTFTVEQTAARHRDVDGWKFRINDNKPYGIPELLNAEESRQVDESRENELRDMLSKYCPEVGGISQTSLQKKIAAGEHVGGKKAWNIIQESIGMGLLERLISGNYRYVKTFPIKKPSEDEEMPF